MDVRPAPRRLDGPAGRRDGPPRRQAVWRDIQGWFWEEVPVITFSDFFTLRVQQKSVAGSANRYRPFFRNGSLAAR